VVTTGGVQRVTAEPQGKLLIAFTPAVVRERGEGDRPLAAGSVLWIGAKREFDVLPSGAGAAHLLEVRLK
jgi:hypothetical protein